MSSDQALAPAGAPTDPDDVTIVTSTKKVRKPAPVPTGATTAMVKLPAACNMTLDELKVELGTLRAECEGCGWLVCQHGRVVSASAAIAAAAAPVARPASTMASRRSFASVT